MRKALADDHGQHVMELAQALAGAYGLLADAGPADADPAGGARSRRRRAPRRVPAWPASVWAKGYLFSRALTIGGGTAEVQRNIIAERVLGLPHDIDVESDRAWDAVAAAVAGLRRACGTSDARASSLTPRALAPGHHHAGRRRRRRRDG